MPLGGLRRTRRWTENEETEKKVVLHVGCGSRSPANLVHKRFQGPEWREVRLDIDPSVRPDIVASIVDLKPVDSTSVDAIWSSHNLEHVSAHEVPDVLASFFRVLRPGGSALITLPDLQAVAKQIAVGKLEDTLYTSPAGPIMPLDVVYGHGASIAGGNDFMAHRTGFTAKTLEGKLRAVGFADVSVQRREFALWALASKPG
jgi:SAM-dependent methyltransferase